jgi:hypothetical protein
LASAKAGQADPSTALSAGATASVFASLSTLDAIVVRVVGKALLGDMRAIGWICDVIEGRPERCRGDVRASPRRLLSSARAKNLRPGGVADRFHVGLSGRDHACERGHG